MSVSGALGPVVVSLNSGEELTVPANSRVEFKQTLSQGSSYRVTITRTPEHQDCSVSNGSGTVTSDVAVAIGCVLQKYPLSGSLAGLDKPGLTVLETISNQQVQPDVGTLSFQFAGLLAYGQPYLVTLSSTPEGRDCALDGGTGGMDASVSSIFVGCAPQYFPLSGLVRGLAAGTVTIAERSQSLALDGGPFTFPQPLEWDSQVSVRISAQPGGFFCRLDGGEGVMRAAKSDVDVSCKPGSSIGGLVYGLGAPGLVLRELTTAQTLTVAPDAGPIDFTFASSVPSGESYTVVVEVPPQNEVCRVQNGAGTVGGAVRNVRVQCSGAYPDLVVSELSPALTPGTPAWVEVFNATATPKNLADYSLRTGLLQSDGGISAQYDFQLPDASVAPFGFFVLSGRPIADLHDGPLLRHVGTPAATMYFVDAGVELRTAAGVPVDAVTFGGIPTDIGRVLARRLDRGDTNTAADFAIADVATPGGPNDAFDSMDTDADGLPDSAERPGGELAGLPLYDWGARTNQRDVFAEVDWMRPDGGAAFDPGILPRRDALQRVTDVLLAHGIHLHLDVGPLFGAGVMDLGGGNQVPFGCTLTMVGSPGPTSFYAVKAAGFDLRRRASFHYVLFGNSLADVACGGLGATGRADILGNDVAITLGNRGYTTAPATQLNRLVNAMSSTLMHELGHNFGLRHGGNEDANFKPNYLSVMNYLYQLEGLPQIGNAEGDRYYYVYGGLYGLCAGAPAIASRNALTRNAFSAPGTFSLDYSDGKSIALDKAALDETRGMGRLGSVAVDWSYDTIIAGAVSANIDALGSAAPACPRNNPSTGVVSDHDDWAALNLVFNRTALGTSSGKRLHRPREGIDLIGDRQPLSDETPIVER